MSTTPSDSPVAPSLLRWSGLTDVGRFRPNNEDAFLALNFDGHDVRYLGKTGEASLAGKLPRDTIAKELARAGIDATDGLLDGLLEEAQAHAERRELEDEQRARIDALDVPVYELPRLPDGIDLGGLYELAAELREQGMA